MRKSELGIIATIYHWGQRQRLSLLLGLMGLLVIGGYFVTKVPMQEDIEVMLPDSDPAFVSSYALLKEAPLTRSVVIDLEIKDPNQLDQLLESARALGEALEGPLISKVVAGLDVDAGPAMLDWLYAHLPQYFDEQTAAMLEEQLKPERVAQTLQENLNALATPEGLWLRRWLGKDPLALRNQVFRRLGGVAMLPDARIEEGFLIDPTGCHTLLLAETPVSMGDSRQGEELLAFVHQAIAQAVPDDVTAHVVCAHRYTVANAQTIKRDLVTVFMVSSIGLLLVFALWLRHWRALYVFAVPVPAILIGVMVSTLILGSVSAITVGFGAVLLGISVDYALHVFFVLRQRRDDPAAALSHLAVPMVVSCVTTVGAFAVLLASGVPIQRQLSVFAITGLITALILALVWLPHWIMGGGQTASTAPSLTPKRHPWMIPIWGVILVVAIPLSLNLSFDGDLRKVGLTPPEVLADEMLIRDVWSDPRGRALVVTQADDAEVALEAYEATYAQLADVWGMGELVSVAPLALSAATQEENLQRWQDFWAQDNRSETFKQVLTEQGGGLGFKPTAFAPFLDMIDQTHAPFAVDDLRDVTGPMLDSFFMRRDTGLGLIALVPDGNEAIEAFGPTGLSLPEESQAVSQQRFAATLRTSLAQDFQRFLLRALGMVVIVLSITLRCVRTVVMCLLPALTGLLVMLAIMGVTGLQVNMFNMAASVLVLGLSIDYGVFMVKRSEYRDGAVERAVIASALTTLSGFGALALAQHPAMFSLGITVVLGIVPAMLCALLVLPVLQRDKS